MKAESDKTIAPTQHAPSINGRRTAVRLVAIATAAGLILRLAFALWYWVDKPLTHDEQEYLLLARSLASGQGFTYPPLPESAVDVERFGRPPVYPFVLSRVAGESLIAAMPSSVPRSLKVAQSIVGSLGITLVASVAWRVAGPSAGAVAALLTAIHPPLAWTSAYALSEGLYFVVIWSSVLLLGMAIDRMGRPVTPGRDAILVTAAGLVGGIAALTRPSALVYLGIGTVWLAASARRRLATLFLIGAIVAIAPWTARNFREYGRFVLIASEGGINFWIGNHPLARGEGDMAANPAIKRAKEALRMKHPNLGAEELEPVYYREAFDYIVSHPVWWAGLIARKLFYLFVPVGPSYGLHSRLYHVASVVPYLVLLPLAIGGALTIRRARAPAGALGLLFASSVLVYLMFFPQERYRIPEIDPTLIVCAAVWVGARRAVRDRFGEHV